MTDTRSSSGNAAVLADRLETECTVRDNHPDDYCPDLTKLFRECVFALRAVAQVSPEQARGDVRREREALANKNKPHPQPDGFINDYD